MKKLFQKLFSKLKNKKEFDSDEQHDFDPTSAGTQKLKNQLTQIKNKVKDSFHFRSHKYNSGAQRAAQKINWDKINEVICSEKFHPHLHRFFLIFFSVSIFYSSGKMIGLFLDYKSGLIFKTRTIQLQRPYPLAMDLRNLGQKNPFQVKLSDKVVVATDEKKPKPKIINCLSATKITSLPIKLLNTVVLQDEVKSLAAVQVRSGKLANFRQGEKIEEMAKIFKIERLRVNLHNLQNDECEYVENKTDKSAPRPISVLSPVEGKKLMAAQKPDGIENDGNNFKIKKNLLKEKLDNQMELLSQIKADSITNPDGTFSFKLSNIEPGSVFSYLNIQENDIISQINGRPIADLTEIFSLFGQIKSQSINKVNLTVTRDGVETPLHFDFVE